MQAILFQKSIWMKMVTDSRAKGARAETVVRDKLRELTGLNWERVPSSGALDPKHGLKADLYVPNEKNLYAVEVKHYKDTQLDSSILTAKDPLLLTWMAQAIRQGEQVSKTPLLIFKHDRSPLFVAFDSMPTSNYRFFYISAKGLEFYVSLLDEWYKAEQPKFI